MGLSNLLRGNYGGELHGIDQSACVRCLALETVWGLERSRKRRKPEIEGRSRTNRNVDEKSGSFSSK